MPCHTYTGAWKRLDHSAIPNPLLVYQIESQLRERVLQELELLASPSTPHALLAKEDNSKDSEDGRQGEEKPTPILRILPDIAAAEIERTKTVRRALFHAHITEDADSKSTLNPPSALFDFSDPASSEVIPEGQVSALLPYITPELENFELLHLAQHRVPIYAIPRLFQLDLGGPEIGTSASAPKATSANEVETLRVPLWSALRCTRPDIHDREVIKIQKQRETFERLVSSLSTPHSKAMQSESLRGRIVAVPSMSGKVVPLLKALWRYRMWLGEGWSGDGFGVLEATGRKRPF